MTQTIPFRSFFRLLLPILLMTALLLPAAAADREIIYNEDYFFTKADFATSDGSAAPRGILLTEVPDSAVGTLYFGNRQLSIGDALSAEDFEKIRFSSCSAGDESASLSWIPVFSRSPAPETSLLIHIGNGKNQPPVAENSSLETYRNIPIDGSFLVSDADDAVLSFTVVKEPKRGTVSINQDGTYLYTPAKNKVGKDSFTVQVSDSAGNTADITIQVSIIKPTDKTTFADLDGDTDQYYAMWLREEGVYAGQKLSGALLFQPEQEVSRGAFLVMAMDLLDIEPMNETLSTGFADEAETPSWMQPYLLTALRSGFISGVESSEGLCFRPDAAVTQAEAAVMLQNMLGLEHSNVISVFHDEELPVWAADAITCLSGCGVTELTSPSQSMTMRQTARLLYQIHQLWQSDQLSTSLLAWAADA